VTFLQRGSRGLRVNVSQESLKIASELTLEIWLTMDTHNLIERQWEQQGSHAFPSWPIRLTENLGNVVASAGKLFQGASPGLVVEHRN
jgi:hypothetical protein